MSYDLYDTQTGKLIPPQQVVVTDFDMKFGSMVTFMVKWAIAAIPALLILMVVGGFAAALIVAAVNGSK